jgi:hypothetical protein
MKKTNGFEENAPACSAESQDCGCSHGMCPGTILGGIILAGWGLYAVGAWVWSMLAN